MIRIRMITNNKIACSTLNFCEIPLKDLFFIFPGHIDKENYQYLP